MTEPTQPPAINRELIADDLARVSQLLTPALEGQMEALYAIPILGARLRSQLQGSLGSTLFGALARILALTDEELAALVDLVGVELGAWRGFNDLPGQAELDAAGPAYRHLLEVS